MSLLETSASRGESSLDLSIHKPYPRCSWLKIPNGEGSDCTWNGSLEDPLYGELSDVPEDFQVEKSNKSWSTLRWRSRLTSWSVSPESSGATHTSFVRSRLLSPPLAMLSLSTDFFDLWLPLLESGQAVRNVFIRASNRAASAYASWMRSSILLEVEHLLTLDFSVQYDGNLLTEVDVDFLWPRWHRHIHY